MFTDDSLLSRIAQGLLGALGIYAAIRFLPRLFKSLTKRFVVGLIGEILLVAFSLFLTDRATRARPNGSREPGR
jgi:hypothetical protein